MVVLRLYFSPVVVRLVLHKHAMLLKSINRGAHLGIGFEYLGQEVLRSLIDALLVQLDLTRQNLFLELDWVVLYLERQRAGKYPKY